MKNLYIASLISF